MLNLSAPTGVSFAFNLLYIHLNRFLKLISAHAPVSLARKSYVGCATLNVFSSWARVVTTCHLRLHVSPAATSASAPVSDLNSCIAASSAPEQQGAYDRPLMRPEPTAWDARAPRQDDSRRQIPDGSSGDSFSYTSQVTWTFPVW